MTSVAGDVLTLTDTSLIVLGSNQKSVNMKESSSIQWCVQTSFNSF